MCYLSWDQWRADVDAGARESLSTEGPVVVVHVSVQLSSGLAFNVLLLGSCVLLRLPLSLMLLLLLLLPAILLLSSRCCYLVQERNGTMVVCGCPSPQGGLGTILYVSRQITMPPAKSPFIHHSIRTEL